ncbi:MAG TPA: hypothetical protein VMV19_18235 [Xanthobacteraceae bacterium]|nr:hypothetical protein [Xanthobacteraceae bacterium]
MADDLHLGKNELLARAADRAVLAGKLVPSAAADLTEMFRQKCIVDTTLNTVTLDGKSLDDAVAAEIAKHPHWQPENSGAPEIKARTDLEEKALAGSVTAHGLLLRSLGKSDYEKWLTKTGAKPGKAVNDGEHSDNPWAPGPSFSVTKQGKILRALGEDKARAMAKAAGVELKLGPKAPPSRVG